ncbi:MAG: CNNM domain-containing protein, partial [Bacillota bacterium]|nr:CNNM domain-containing protein [Bacillota bacterium]
MLILQLIAIFVLIGITAVFVAAEFAIVKIRGSKINQLIESGDSRA